MFVFVYLSIDIFLPNKKKQAHVDVLLSTMLLLFALLLV